MFDDFRFDGDLVLIFGFVIAIILINAIAHVMRVNAQQKTIREALASGQTLDAKTVKALGIRERDDEGSRGGLATGGLILIAAAAALVIFGFMLNIASGEDEIIPVMIGVSAFPGLIGVALLLVAAFKKGDDEA